MKISPCPFCTFPEPILLPTSMKLPFDSYVGCPSCDARGPACRSQFKAVQKWNFTMRFREGIGQGFNAARYGENGETFDDLEEYLLALLVN